jgi:ABC-type sugar transport system ATPase subunit
MRARTRELLGELHVPVSPDMLMEHVSAANAQLVQVARALAFDCRVLVLDEPTTSLTDAEVDHLFKILAALKARGVTILFVSHRLPEVFRLCDRITVLRDGALAGTFTKAETTPDTIVRAMAGREPPARVERPPVDANAKPVLAVRGCPARLLFGDVAGRARGRDRRHFRSGGIGQRPRRGCSASRSRRPANLLNGGRCNCRRCATPLAPASRWSRKTGSAWPAFQPQRGEQHRPGGGGAPDSAASTGRRNSAQALITSLAIRSAAADRTPDTLSGGNQQKVVAAGGLAPAPRTLLDEPTRA